MGAGHEGALGLCTGYFSSLVSTPVSFISGIKVFRWKTVFVLWISLFNLMNSGRKSLTLLSFFVQAEVHNVHGGLEMGNMPSWTVTLSTIRYPQMKLPVIFRRDQDLPVSSWEMLLSYTSSWVEPALWHVKWWLTTINKLFTYQSPSHVVNNWD